MLVLSIQLLPLKQTFAWLLGNQVTEELVHTDEPGSDGHGHGPVKHYLPVYSPTLHSTLHQPSFKSLSDYQEGLPGRHADDIPTPPPNC